VRPACSTKNHERRRRLADPLDRGHTLVESFDDSSFVVRTLSKPPFPFRLCEAVFFLVRRAAHAPDGSLFCARAVSPAASPRRAMPRMYQQIYAWSVRDRDDEQCLATALVSIPDNLLPAWIIRMSSVAGWPTIKTVAEQPPAR
jgi:hypothetical protein